MKSLKYNSKINRIPNLHSQLINGLDFLLYVDLYQILIEEMKTIDVHNILYEEIDDEE